MKIRSKREFFELWEAGMLGNRPPLWRRVEDIPAAIERVGFREIGRAGGGKWTLVSRVDAERECEQWRREGRNFIMDGSVPNHASVLQGEVARTYRGLESFLAIGHALPPMRLSMREGLHRDYGGAVTLHLVQRFMDPASQDDLHALLDLYPDATIEFTAFSLDTGVIPGRNTIFWETRDY
jgi:hypothetical protein